MSDDAIEGWRFTAKELRQQEEFLVGDGTPGPAREAAPERVTLYDRGNPYWWSAAGPGANPQGYGEPLGVYVRAELGRAPNVWEEAAKVCEEAQAEMKGTRWSGAAACIRALRARADAERREPGPMSKTLEQGCDCRGSVFHGLEYGARAAG